MIGHKKQEESQKEDRQVLFLCLLAFFVAISLFSSRSGLHDFNMASPSFAICANLPARRGGRNLRTEKSIHPQIAPIDADSGTP